MDDRGAEVRGQRKASNDPRNHQHNPQCANYWAPLTPQRHHKGHTGRSGRQKAATRRNMRRDDRGTVQGPVKKLQPDALKTKFPVIYPSK